MGCNNNWTVWSTDLEPSSRLLFCMFLREKTFCCHIKGTAPFVARETTLYFSSIGAVCTFFSLSDVIYDDLQRLVSDRNSTK